jgi:hypothetical protein
VDNCSTGIRESLLKKETQAPGHFVTGRKTSYLLHPLSVWLPKIVNDALS